ncbi:hypothetical protein [Chondrinema litorale]|uniref:hypothetical protein n=1 Tax=Chondrinema litorale TaxID=2994555 RepID=UPI002543300E|nr:hypothetical protein [Chondrinema litorale]UZR92408.1 hypothetical protein OQ292_11105 [Chondrinema litorale]
MLKINHISLFLVLLFSLFACGKDEQSLENHIQTLNKSIEVLRHENLRSIDKIHLAIENKGRRPVDVEHYKRMKQFLNKTSLNNSDNIALIHYLHSLDTLYQLEQLEILDWDELYQRALFYAQEAADDKENYLLSKLNLLLIEKEIIQSVAMNISSCCQFYRNFNSYSDKELYFTGDTVNVLWVTADCYDVSPDELMVYYADTEIVYKGSESKVEILNEQKIGHGISIQFIAPNPGKYQLKLQAVLQSVFSSENLKFDLEKVVEVN